MHKRQQSILILLHVSKITFVYYSLKKRKKKKKPDSDGLFKWLHISNFGMWSFAWSKCASEGTLLGFCGQIQENTSKCQSAAWMDGCSLTWLLHSTLQQRHAAFTCLRRGQAMNVQQDACFCPHLTAEERASHLYVWVCRISHGPNHSDLPRLAANGISQSSSVTSLTTVV